jgi:hypothetical protein
MTSHDLCRSLMVTANRRMTCESPPIPPIDRTHVTRQPRHAPAQPESRRAPNYMRDSDGRLYEVSFQSTALLDFDAILMPPLYSCANDRSCCPSMTLLG